ncbi:cytochrome c oxidase subunit 3 family protein [Mycolicibacterium sp. P9-64]|uniref:cytochrome c oxidase subunit 3 n=1 Tax=Mycolicibacterium sp. P9-64 TaxID=2024612 RepID=UPI0011F018E3|nr:cytochrome c oxidase subunit 3 [Mycolicibacterium sp. P9-64]KAA0080109.1 cytochrome c oxidase subunit 3 family protein [Mycolicibacterium sp. P9-64]
MTYPSQRADYELPEFLGGAAEELTGAPARPGPKSPGHIPGEAGLWIFILGDMTLFAAIMLVFLWDRRSQPEVFNEAAHQLLQPIGAVNTLVLLLSSYLVVRALAAHRAGRYGSAGHLVIGAIGCAAVFGGLKAVEYSSELSSGHTPASGTFFTFYFILTGLHLLHVVVGSALLLAWNGKLKRGRPWAGVQRFIEGIACYWHMVDLLWVAIFALVYLVSAE